MDLLKSLGRAVVLPALLAGVGPGCWGSSVWSAADRSGHSMTFHEASPASLHPLFFHVRRGKPADLREDGELSGGEQQGAPVPPLGLLLCHHMLSYLTQPCGSDGEVTQFLDAAATKICTVTQSDCTLPQSVVAIKKGSGMCPQCCKPYGTSDQAISLLLSPRPPRLPITEPHS